eukprot:gnl/MRDRNA2_/MRDRNA2_124866_c0_seq1.p1 gnl/MRDRNA2_/MRDRNA2_124866_c0~~gnl/MRDRNA2_/MRDRNA2_124866_c0_seq1.p1  ORF type:complete len:279 (+),score=64.46 gnl/MRDRNA2_/MRDRNA2_124866_c0_seq1:76-912(+)
MSGRTAVIFLLAAFEQAHAKFPLLNVRSQVPASRPASVFSSRAQFPAVRTRAVADPATLDKSKPPGRPLPDPVADDWSVLSSKTGQPPVRTYQRSSAGKHAATYIYNVAEPELLVAALNAADYTKMPHGEAHVAPYLGQEYAIPSVRVLGYVKDDLSKFLKESGKLVTSEAAEAYAARKASNKAYDEALFANFTRMKAEREAEAKAKAEEEAAAAEEPAEEEAPAEEAPELFVWDLSNTLSMAAAGLIGCFIGGAVTFAVFGRRFSITRKQPLLAGHS